MEKNNVNFNIINIFTKFFYQNYEKIKLLNKFEQCIIKYNTNQQN